MWLSASRLREVWSLVSTSWEKEKKRKEKKISFNHLLLGYTCGQQKARGFAESATCERLNRLHVLPAREPCCVYATDFKSGVAQKGFWQLFIATFNLLTVGQSWWGRLRPDTMVTPDGDVWIFIFIDFTETSIITASLKQDRSAATTIRRRNWTSILRQLRQWSSIS